MRSIASAPSLAEPAFSLEVWLREASSGEGNYREKAWLRVPVLLSPHEMPGHYSPVNIVPLGGYCPPRTIFTGEKCPPLQFIYIQATNNLVIVFKSLYSVVRGGGGGGGNSPVKSVPPYKLSAGN